MQRAVNARCMMVVACIALSYRVWPGRRDPSPSGIGYLQVELEVLLAPCWPFLTVEE